MKPVIQTPSKLALANIALRNKDYKTAIAIYEEAIEQADEPLKKRIRFNRDHALKKLGKSSFKRESNAMTCILTKPDDLDAYYFQLIQQGSFFDPSWYLAQYKEKYEVTGNPLAHYLTHGLALSTNPSPHFDTAHYVKTHHNLALSGMHPFLHFVCQGHKEDRLVKPLMDRRNLDNYKTDAKQYIPRLTSVFPLSESNKLFKPLSQNTNDRSLRAFGAALLGPVLAKYFSVLIDFLHKNDEVMKINFLSREGFFLKKIFNEVVPDKINKRIDCGYLMVSRALLFKFALIRRNLWEKTLKHPYKGEFLQFLRDRYGFNEGEIEQFRTKLQACCPQASYCIELPKKIQEVISIFEIISEEFVNIVTPKYNAYLIYLESTGYGKNGEEHLIDLGYSGTIQYFLTEMTNVNTVGHYFISTDKAQNTLISRYYGHILNGVVSGSGNPLLERSAFLESILTAPHGSVIDLQIEDSKIKFLFGEKTMAQVNFSALESIVNGAIDYTRSVLDHGSVMDVDELVNYYGKFVSRASNFPKYITSLFDMDDRISGLSTLNPINYFLHQR